MEACKHSIRWLQSRWQGLLALLLMASLLLPCDFNRSLCLRRLSGLRLQQDTGLRLQQDTAKKASEWVLAWQRRHGPPWFHAPRPHPSTATAPSREGTPQRLGASAVPRLILQLTPGRGEAEAEEAAEAATWRASWCALSPEHTARLGSPLRYP